MKNIQIIIAICLSVFSFAQVSIGKDKIDNISTILDFNEINNTKGIILPAVDNVLQAIALNATDNNGTFLLDKSDNKVKMYENNTWVSLSDEGDSSQTFINLSSEVGEGTIIGEQSTNAKGVLVLESENKAILLPKIANPHTSVKNPYPGMFCYDTVSKSVAIFDGKVWNYWK